MLAAGFLPRVGALAIAATLVPTTLAGHPFWKEEDPAKRKTQRVQFLKNMAMMGGVLLATVDCGQAGPGLARPEPRQPVARKPSTPATARGEDRQAERAAQGPGRPALTWVEHQS